MSKVERAYASLRNELPSGAMLSYLDDPGRGLLIV